MNYELMVANCICDSSYLQGNMENLANYEKEDTETLSFKSITKSFIANLLSFNFDVIRCYNLALNIKILKNNIGFYCLSSMLVLQIIFLIVYSVKKLKSLKNFMLIYKDKNMMSGNINSKMKTKTKSAPPPKNKKSIFSPLDNDLEEANNNQKYIKKKLNKLEKEINDNFLDNNDNTTSRKKILSENNNNNAEKELNKKLQNNFFKFSKFQKNKKNSKEKFLFSNNFGQAINIQTPILNINNNNFIDENNRNENNKRK